MLTQIVAGRVYDYSHSVGRNSQSGLGYNHPVAAALGEGDVVYVVSRGTEAIGNVPWNSTGSGARVSIANIGTEPGDEEFVGQFSGYGDEDGQFIWGAGIAVDRQHNVYVTDEWLDRVNIFDKDGNFLNKWSVSENGAGEPYGASGITIDADQNVYVVGSRHHQVRKFSKEGRLTASWGGLGDGPGQLNSPWGITTDRQGHVYVADHRNHRVQKFSPDGEPVARFGSYGTLSGELTYPTGVAVDPEGDIYVSDWSDNGIQPGRVHVFDPEGKFIVSLIGDAQQLSKWGQMSIDANVDAAKARRRVRSTEPEWRFSLPAGLVFDPAKGRLLVVDTQRTRLQIYNKLKDYVEPQLNL